MKAIIYLIAVCCVTYTAAIADTWTQKADIPIGRCFATGFAIGDKGYIGTGAAGNNSNDIWEYDPLLDVWTQKADIPVGRFYGVGFAIGNRGYIGTGASDFGNYEYLDDFWEYDPDANTWTQKADFPGGERFFATGFSIGVKGYIGMGDDATEIKKDFWEYDPLNDTWTKKADLPGGKRYGAVGFGIGLKGYLGTGADASIPYNDLWEYDPSTDVWIQKANFGGVAREQATAFAIGNHGYIGIGDDILSNLVDFWRYDVVADSWEQVADFPGDARYTAVGFSIDNKGYVGTGYGELVPKVEELWEYTPDSLGTPIGNELEQESSLMILPNPAEGSFEVLFSLCENSHTCIELFDMDGNRIKTLYDKVTAAGSHQLSIDCESIEAGLYLLQMKLNEEVLVKKIIIQ